MSLGLWAFGVLPLGWADAAAALMLLAIFAWWCRGSGPAGEEADDVFLARRAWPWWTAAAALLGCELSALAVAAIPAAAFSDGFHYLPFACGALGGKLLVWRFVPLLRGGRPATPYGWIAARLGSVWGRAAAFLFCGGRLAGAALRLAVGALAVSALTGVGPGWCALAAAAVAAAVAGRGGLEAVGRAALFQIGLLATALGCAGVYALMHTPGHLHGAVRLAEEGGRLAAFSDWGSLAGALLHGALGALAALAADHELAQKLLACRDDAQTRRAVAAAAAGSFAAAVGLLGLGAGLYAYYLAHPALAMPPAMDDILSHFASTVLPSPLRGALAAAVFLSAAALPVSSLSAVFWLDAAGAGKAVPAARRHELAWAWATALGCGALILLGRPGLTPVAAEGWPAVSGLLLGLVIAAGARLRNDRAAVLAAALGATLFLLARRG